MSDLASMLRQQMQNTLNSSLDAAVQAGDINAARKVTKDILDLGLAEAKATTAVKAPPSPKDIKAAVAAKADWFGVDPRKTAKTMELAKMMDPERFTSAEAFADALLKTVTEEEKGAAGNDGDDEDGEGEDGDDEDARREARRAKAKEGRKNGTQEPELGTGTRSNGATSNLRRAFETGDIKMLPSASQATIKKFADKFARNGGEDARKAYISNAVKAHARTELINSGKFDPRTNTFK